MATKIRRKQCVGSQCVGAEREWEPLRAANLHAIPKKKLISNIQQRTLNTEPNTGNHRHAILGCFINYRAAPEFRRHEVIAAPSIGYCAATACCALTTSNVIAVAAASSCLRDFVANASVVSLNPETLNNERKSNKRGICADFIVPRSDFILP